MPLIQITQNGPVQEVMIDRPAKKNALTFEMYDELTAAFRAAQENPKVRVLLLHSAGDAFSAGNDLSDFVNVKPGSEDLPPIRFIHQMINLEKTFVVSVQGAAVGIGTTLLLHADLVYAAKNAKFSVPFTNLGLTPEAASSLLLARRIGQAAASDMLLRGAPITADRAYALGLVTELAETPEASLGLARERASEMASKPPAAVRLTKSLLRGDLDVLRAQVKREGTHFGERLQSGEAREAFSAFLERRKPDFSKFE